MFAMLITAVFAVSFALAQSASTDLEGDAGTLPDQTGYGWKLGWEKFKLGFTFNQEKKAQKELDLAKLRLMEAKAMAQKGNLEGMEKAKADHDKLMTRVQGRLDKLGEDQKNLGSMIRLQNAIDVHEAQMENLKDVLTSGNLTDDQRAKIEAKIALMENNTLQLREAASRGEDKVKENMKKAGKNDSEIESETRKFDNLTSETQKSIAAKRINQTEEAIVKLKARIADEKNNGTDVGYFNEQIAAVEKNLAEAKTLYSQEKYADVIATLKPVGNFGRNMAIVMHKVNEARKENKKEDIKKMIDAEKKLREKELNKLKELKEQKKEIREQIKEERKEIREQIKNQSNVSSVKNTSIVANVSAAVNSSISNVSIGSNVSSSVNVSLNSSNAAFVQDIVNCVKGTPWTYSGATSTGTYSVVYTIDGFTQYKGAQYCKVTGKVTGTALPEGYSWEYYFKTSSDAKTYSDVCYKISYPGAPTQEQCVSTSA